MDTKQVTSQGHLDDFQSASQSEQPLAHATEIMRILGDELPPVRASADRIIAVTMDAHFQLRSVTLQGLNLELDVEARLEQAITTVVNAAIQAVAKQKGERLKQVIGRMQKPIVSNA